MFGFGYGYGYPYDYYGYGNSYSYYAPNYIARSDVIYEDPSVQLIEEDPSPRAGENGTADTKAGKLFLQRAEAAFRKGSYPDAVRLAGHAAVEMPRNAEVHQFMALALFALKDYRGAASAIHAALALAQPWDWPTLSKHYARPADYTQQLRALEKQSRDDPSAAHVHFLLGYQYFVLKHTDSARRQFSRAVELAPEDELAPRLLRSLGADDRKGAPEAPLPPLGRAPAGEGHQHQQGDQPITPVLNSVTRRSGTVPTGSLDALSSLTRGQAAPLAVRPIVSDEMVPWSVASPAQQLAGVLAQQRVDLTPASAAKESKDQAPVLTKVPEEMTGISLLPPEDRALALAQRTCPVTGDLLGSDGKPFKVQVADGRIAFVCCEGCIRDLKEDPQRYLGDRS